MLASLLSVCKPASCCASWGGSRTPSGATSALACGARSALRELDGPEGQGSRPRTNDLPRVLSACRMWRRAEKAARLHRLRTPASQDESVRGISTQQYAHIAGYRAGHGNRLASLAGGCARDTDRSQPREGAYDKDTIHASQPG